jgi:putative ABC transport system permease protein
MTILPLLRALIRAHVLQRPVRVLLSIIGVALGVLASVAIGAANIEVLRSFEQAVTTVAGPASLEIVGHDLGVDETVITAVRQVPGVVTAAPLLEETVVVAGGAHRDEAVQVFGLDLLAEAEGRGFQLHEVDREQAIEDLFALETIYLGRSLAADWHLAAGSLVDVMAGGRLVSLRVAGLISGQEERFSLWNRVSVMDLAAAQVLFSSIGRLDRIELVTQPDRPLDDIANEVRSVLPPHLIVQRPAQRTKQVENMVRSFQLNLTVLSWVGLLVGTFLIYNTMAFAVAQRRREIGIYRALGMTESRVAGLFLLEGGLLGLIGGLLGGLGGVWLSQTLVSLVSRTIADLYVPVASNGMVLSLDAHSILAVGKGILFGTVVAMVGALGPSLEASRTITVRALAPGDYEQTQQVRTKLFLWLSVALLVLAGLCSLMGPVASLPVFGYLATLFLLASLACLSPVCIQALGRRSVAKENRPMLLGGSLRRIAANHAARHPGRNAVTVSALMVGLAIMIGVVVMVRSFRETVEVWVNDTVMADLIVAPPTWMQGKQVGQASRALPDTLMPLLSSIEGVAGVDTYRDVHVEAQGQSVVLVSRDLRLHAQRSRYLLLQDDSTTTLTRAAESGGVLLSEVLANRLSLHTGGTVAITTPQGPKTVPVEGVFYDYATDGGKIVMDRSRYRQLWDDHLVTVFAVYLSPGAESERVREAMVRALADEEGKTVPPIVIRNKELRQEILDIFDRTFVLTYVLEIIAVLVAVLGIVNTLVTAVLERRRELATLQAIGASTKQVEQLVLWEAIYLGVIGSVLGVVGGLALAWVLIAVINKQSFGWTIRMTIPVGLLLQAVVLAVSAAWIAGYFPARWAARQPVVEGLREE